MALPVLSPATPGAVSGKCCCKSQVTTLMHAKTCWETSGHLEEAIERLAKWRHHCEFLVANAFSVDRDCHPLCRALL